MNATFAGPPPPGRLQDFSPASTGDGSEWSGMNHYNSGMRPDGNYNGQMGYPRNDSDGPPEPGHYNGPPPRTFPPPNMDGPHRPRRPSESGSQQSSRAGSIAHSRSSDGTISDQQSRKFRRMENELQQHYTILKNFLKGGAAQPPRPNKARDKLLRLSPLQFHELSTDVFDELQRRQASAPLPGRGPRRDNVPPFLQPRQEFHEKRNQARQKLSSLQTSRFRDLSTDVFCELERRFPHFAGPDARHRDSTRSTSSRGGRGPPPPRVSTTNLGPGGPHAFPQRNASSLPRDVPQFDNPPSAAMGSGGDFGRPIPKQFQSNTITPNKSTMVEDDEDDNGTGLSRSSDAYGPDESVTSPSSDRGTPATSVMNSGREMKSLQDRISDLESNLRHKDDDLASLREELDKKVADAEKLQQSLKEEIDKLHREHTNRERDLHSQLSSAKRSSGDGGVWKAKHDQLKRDHGELQILYKEQQQITEEVSRQGEEFLREMRAMAEEQDDGALEREEKLQLEVNRLREELIQWKARYAQSGALGHGNQRMLPNGIQPAKIDHAAAGGTTFRHAHGMIAEVHIGQFQMAIDELLQAARSQEPTSTMDALKSVVLAVRNIAVDIDGATAGVKDDDGLQARLKLKARVAATANNVITACKNHAAAGGIAPVSLLDAAASHLSAAVVDLARTVKIRPSSDSEHHELDARQLQPVPDGTPEPMNDAGYFTMSQRLRSESPVDSIYSVLSGPDEEIAIAPNNGGSEGVANDAHQALDPVGSTGLGIQAGLKMKEDDTELQELKIYLENQTDLLVQDIQALVSSIRQEERMPAIHRHITSILDVVENVLSATEGAMDDESWFQPTLKARATSAVNALALSRDKLLETANDADSQNDGPASKSFTQKLPPLAFRLARETKDLVTRVETVALGVPDGNDDDDDFS